MSREEINGMFERYAKKSKNIEYSTKVYGEKEGEIKPEIKPIDIRTEDSDKPSLFLILKYKTLNGDPLEVIIAKLGNINDRARRTKEIIELIKGQLRDNAKGEEGYNFYEKLQEYLKTEGMSLEFTLEGIDILSTKSKKEVPIKRTQRINNNGKVEKLFSDQEIKIMRETNIPEIIKYTVWKNGREEALKNFSTNEERQAFLKGEKIANIMQNIRITDRDTDETIKEKVKNRKKFAINYLLEVNNTQNSYEQNTAEQIRLQQMDEKIRQLKEQLEQRKNMNLNPQQKIEQNRVTAELLKGYMELINKGNADIQQSIKQPKIKIQEYLNKYIKIKEKGLAIDVNKALENLEKNSYNQMENKINEQKEIPKETKEEVKKWQEGQHFFTLTKQGFEKMARIFATQTSKVDLEFLIKSIKDNECHDEELLKYIELKQKILEEAQTDDIQNNEDKYPSVKELYEFILKSRIRESTRDDDKKMLSEIYKISIDMILTTNADEINLYNKVAKKYGGYVCPTSDMKSQDLYTAKVNKTEKTNSDEKQNKVYSNIDKILEEVNEAHDKYLIDDEEHESK